MLKNSLTLSILFTGFKGFAADEFIGTNLSENDGMYIHEPIDRDYLDSSSEQLPDIETILEAAIKKVEEQNPHLMETNSRSETPGINNQICLGHDQTQLVIANDRDDPSSNGNMSNDKLAINKRHPFRSYSQVVIDSIAKAKEKPSMATEFLERIRLNDRSEISEGQDDLFHHNAFVNTPRKVSALTRMTLKKSGYTNRFWWKSYLSVPKGH